MGFSRDLSLENKHVCSDVNCLMVIGVFGKLSSVVVGLVATERGTG